MDTHCKTYHLGREGQGRAALPRHGSFLAASGVKDNSCAGVNWLELCSIMQSGGLLKDYALRYFEKYSPKK